MNFIPSPLLSLLRHRFAAIVALLLLTLILTYPTITTLTTHVVDLQDPLLNTWIMAWEAHIIRGGGDGSLFTTNIFYPLRDSLAFSEILLSTTLIVMPLTWATDSPILSYNVAFLFAFFSTALGAYLLALYLTGNRGAALVAAVAFAWSPYRMGHLSQLQLLTFGWLPLALIYLDRLLRQRGNTPRNATLLGLFLVLQALASFYAALFAGIACLVYGVAWLIWKRRLSLWVVAGTFQVAIMLYLFVAPFAQPYFAVQRQLGGGWTLADNERFSASLQAYAYAPEGTLFWDELTRPLAYTYGACCPPDSLFPGAAVVGLSLFALWKARGGRRGIWLTIAIIAFVLSLGPTLTIAAGEPTEITLPYKWLYENAPFFNGLRAPVRWVVLVTLALSLLAAVGVAKWRWRWGWAVALAVVVAEFALLPLRLVPLPEAPDSLAWLAAQPQSHILEIPLVAELPRPDVEGAEWQEPRLAWEVSRLLEMQYFSTLHWHTTLDGYSGYVPSRHGDFARELQSLPSERAFLLLRGLGIEYLIVHQDELSAEATARWQRPLPEGVTELPQVGNDRILQLADYDNPPPNANRSSGGWSGLMTEESVMTIPDLTLPPDTEVTIPLIIENPTPLVLGRSYQEWLSVGWDGEAMLGATDWQSKSRHMEYPPLFDLLTVLPITVTTPAPGTHTLLVYAFPAAHIWNSGIEAETTITIAPNAPLPPDFLPVTLAKVESPAPNRYRLTWQSYQPLLHDYSISVRVVDRAGNVLAQQDGAPGGDLPTSAWLAGEEYAADFTVELPATEDSLELLVIWYDPTRTNGARVWDGAGFVESLRMPLP